MSQQLLPHKGRMWRVPNQHYSQKPDEALFFYGGPFSNFVGGPFEIRSEQPYGRVSEFYPTVEHFFQASKAQSLKIHNVIRSMSDPGNAKARGREIPLRKDWERVKYDYMLAGLRVKFSRSNYRRLLVATGDRYICEDSPIDQVWGIRDGNGSYNGQNLLGLALMEVRNEIRSDRR